MIRLLSRVARATRALWLFVGAVLLCLALVEAASRLWLLVMPSGEVPVHAYGIERVYTRSGISPGRWRSYVYWRSPPFDGEWVHVDENGLRRTWNVPEPPPDARQVFFFGGSTTWGGGSRDGFTIPSLVSKRFAAAGPPIVVTNFGQNAYVSTQELLTLMLELRSGNVPDVAVFYHGANDVWSAYETGEAGMPLNEIWRRLDYESFPRYALARLARRSGALTLLRRAVPGVGDGRWQAPESDAEIPALAAAVVESYRANLELVDALAARYGFAVVTVWQPVIWSKPSWAPVEEALVVNLGRRYPRADRLFRATYARVASDPELAARPGFHDLQGVFGSSDAPLFYDFCHVSERGNERVAEAISAKLRVLLDDG